MNKFHLKLATAIWLILHFSAMVSAQKLDGRLENDLLKRVRIAPESVFESFRGAGMNPVNHELSPAEKKKVNDAFVLLPPLHQRIVKAHLQSISFMDIMPNTALTSFVDSIGGRKMFNITFRAGILKETISEWATWKENTCFNPDSTHYNIRVEAGDMDAFLYALLHEVTHVVDAVKQITPYFEKKKQAVSTTPFVKSIWQLATLPEKPYIDSLLDKTRFRSGNTLPISLAPEVYKKLSRTPFPSLYGMAAWSEDLAELISIYHLTHKLNQTFSVVVSKNDVELIRFEPMKSTLVQKRLDQLAAFYVQ